MSELLQSDITDESAASALVDYLSKLEEIAKLDPCGIHYFPAPQHGRRCHTRRGANRGRAP